jgi:hypothetical protein
MQRSRLLLVSVLLLALGTLPGADPPAATPTPPPLPQKALPLGWSAIPPGMETVSPGREIPRKSAHPGALEVDWGDYRTYLVIGDGQGTLRPAWVLTYNRGADITVAYRGMAYLDHFGILHIDCRNATVVGANAEHWSPDSFAVFATGATSTLDDGGSAEHGGVTRSIPSDSHEFHDLQIMAQILVNENS